MIRFTPTVFQMSSFLILSLLVLFAALRRHFISHVVIARSFRLLSPRLTLITKSWYKNSIYKLFLNVHTDCSVLQQRCQLRKHMVCFLNSCLYFPLQSSILSKSEFRYLTYFLGQMTQTQRISHGNFRNYREEIMHKIPGTLAHK